MVICFPAVRPWKLSMFLSRNLREGGFPLRNGQRNGRIPTEKTSSLPPGSSFGFCKEWKNRIKIKRFPGGN